MLDLAKHENGLILMWFAVKNYLSEKYTLCALFLERLIRGMPRADGAR